MALRGSPRGLPGDRDFAGRIGLGVGERPWRGPREVRAQAPRMVRLPMACPVLQGLSLIALVLKVQFEGQGWR